jgi:CzcA family heavy metal efflux pump
MDIGSLLRRRAKSTLFVVLVLALAGLATAFRLPVALFPDIAFPRIAVAADAGEMPADRMMITVTRRLEEAVKSIPDILSVRSTTSRGTSELSINFRWNVDMVAAELLVNNALNQTRNELPADTQISVRKMNPTVAPIIGYSLVSDQRSLVELRTLAEYTLRPALTSIDGVAQVEVLGGRTREYEVMVSPERLRSFHLSLGDLIAAIQSTNVVGSVGRIEQDYQLYLTLVDGQYAGPEQIGRTLVDVRDHMPVFLDDVAVIRESTRPEWTRVTSNGREAVLLNVYQQPGGNTVRIDAQIRSALAAIKDQLPADLTLSKFYDQSDLIVESMASVRDSIVVGLLLAMVLLLLFLRDWKITLIVLLDVPLVIAITVLIMRACGMSFNIMTLGGIAAALGLIIDDAIVVVENVIRHLALRRTSAAAAVQVSVAEILPPILGSSLSTIVVFAPLVFLTGVTGAFFRSLSLTMAASLLVSLLLSLSFIPLLAQHWITEREAARQEKESRLFGFLHRHYEVLLAALCRRRYLGVVAAVLLVAGSYALYRGLPSGFLPDMDEGTFILDYRTPPGTSLEETDRVLRQIERILATVPEIVSYSRRTGLQLGGALTEADMGDFLVRLQPRRGRDIEAIIDDVRQQVLHTVPGIDIEFAQLMGDLIGDLTAVPQPIEIKVFGDDYARIVEVSRQVMEQLQQVDGVVDLYDGITIAGSSIVIKVDHTQAGMFGLSAAAIQQEVAAALSGTVASQVQEAQYMSAIRVRYPLGDRQDLERLQRLRLRTPAGEYISLATVATVSVQQGQAQLTRENLKQMIAVTARISGRDMGSTLRDIQARIRQHIVLPPQVFIQYGGLYQEQQKSFTGLLAVLAMAILLVFTVQLVEFESFRIPLVVLLVDILSLFGVLLLLRLTGVGLNISSMMGMVMIVGIVAENAIFLIHYVERFRAEGLSVQAAVVEAGKTRMRPILMTTLAAVCALTPLAVGIGAGAQMQQPLAIAVIGGFAVSAVLQLLLLPVFYVLLFESRPRMAPVRR